MTSNQAARRHVRVFLSSPQDVAQERAIAARVLGQLPYDPFLRGRVTLEIVAWDGPAGRLPMTATATPQAAIDRGLTRPSECDVVILILWNRMGTILPEAYRRRDGTRYQSGTEWEYEEAITATEPPQILIYRRIGPGLPPAEEDAGTRQQREQVERFFLGFRNADGSLCGGVNTYLDLSHFETQLEYHLREILRRLLSLTPADEQAFQANRLDAAAPAHSTLGRPTTVDVQLCQPGSRGLLSERAAATPATVGDSPQAASSQIAVVFQKQGVTLLPTIVHIDIVAPHHEPVRSTQSVLLQASQDSPVISFSLEPRQPGLARIHVAVAQDLAAGARITCGTVILEAMVDTSQPEDVQQLWTIATRLMGGGLDGPQVSAPRATLTLRVVENAERKTVEKYLTLEVSQLCSLLAATRTDGSTIFSPTGQQNTGLTLLDQLAPSLTEFLSADSELSAFLEDHSDVSDVDLVLLLESRIADFLPMYSARVLGTIAVKAGLLDLVKQRLGVGTRHAAPPPL